MRRGQIAFIVIIIMGASWLAYWFNLNFEQKTYTANQGPQGEAVYNDWLAAEFLLRQGGVKAESKKGLPVINELTEKSTLFVATGREQLAKHHNFALLKWVKRGGHLIITPNYDTYYEDATPEDDPLLSVTPVWVANTGDELAENESFTSNVSIIDKQIDVYTDYVLTVSTPNLLWAIENNDGLQIVDIAYGDGFITVTNELYWAQNRMIGQKDHAEIFYTLATLHYPQADFIFWENQDMPWLPVWLYEKAPQFSIFLIVLILFTLWAFIPRFGNIRHLPETGRRQWIEHIDATGFYLWHYQKSKLLLDAARSQLLTDMKQRRPDIQQPITENSMLTLAQLSGLTEKQIQQALVTATSQNKQDFSQQIQLIQAIRNSI